MDLLGESVCPYCGVGCRLSFEGAGGQVQRVRGVAAAPANLGGLCAKGAQLGPTIHTADRLAKPQLRLSRHDAFQNVDWQTALRYVGEIFTNILNTHGPEAVAFYGSGQLDTETVYLITKLFKGHLGCNNTDSNSRLCMAAAVAGYKTSLGSDGPPTCYDDIELADVILIMGSNTAEAHPVTFDRIRASKKARPHQQIVVIDPRRTATAAGADLYLPVQPGGDIALLNALGRMLLTMGALDRAFVDEHTRGFEDYRQFLMAQDVAELCDVAGIPAGELFALAARIAEAGTLLSLYCMGLNQSTVGMWKNNSLINLHLLTGQIGKPGAGPFVPSPVSPNAMGGREGGLLSHQLPGYRTVEDAQHRADAEAFWHRRPETISPRAGLTAVEMFRALEKGQLKAIWIAGTNPAVSLPDLHHVRRALQKAQLVVVQDAYHPTETSRLADVILPVAQWGEKEWTSTNSERMVSYSPRLWDPPGEALPDWEILSRFAQTLGFKNFQYASPAEVWDEFIRMTAGRPCDMAGATARRLRQLSSLQWPCPAPDHPGSKRRYLDRKFADAGRPGHLLAARPQGAARGSRPRVSLRPHHGPALCPLAHAHAHGQVGQARQARAPALRGNQSPRCRPDRRERRRFAANLQPPRHRAASRPAQRRRLARHDLHPLPLGRRIQPG